MEYNRFFEEIIKSVDQRWNGCIRSGDTIESFISSNVNADPYFVFGQNTYGEISNEEYDELLITLNKSLLTYLEEKDGEPRDNWREII